MTGNPEYKQLLPRCKRLLIQCAKIYRSGPAMIALDLARRHARIANGPERSRARRAILRNFTAATGKHLETRYTLLRKSRQAVAHHPRRRIAVHASVRRGYRYFRMSDSARPAFQRCRVAPRHTPPQQEGRQTSQSPRRESQRATETDDIAAANRCTARLYHGSPRAGTVQRAPIAGGTTPAPANLKWGTI